MIDSNSFFSLSLFIGKEEEIKKELKAFLGGLKKEIEDLCFGNLAYFLDLNSKQICDENFQKIRKVFLNLNFAVYYFLAIKFFLEEYPQNYFLFEILKEIENFLEDLSKKIPWHRFIPLNKYRCFILKFFNKEYQRYFPWYEKWSDKDPAIFEYLIKNNGLEHKELCRAVLADKEFYRLLVK